MEDLTKSEKSDQPEEIKTIQVIEKENSISANNEIPKPDPSQTSNL